MRFPALALLMFVLVVSLAACRNTGGTGGGTASAGSPDNGKALFTAKGCITCHTLSAVPGANGTIGPNLNGVATRAGTAPDHAGAKPPETAAQYINESIQDPAAFVVPGFPAPSQGGMVIPVPVNDQERQDLVAFLLQQK